MPVLLKNYFTDLCWFIRTFFNKQNFIDKLQQKDWFNLVKIVMRQAVSAVHEMKENYSSLIIVSKDSQDRVPLISSVIQLLADPYYRTIEGFYVIHIFFFYRFIFSNCGDFKIFLLLFFYWLKVKFKQITRGLIRISGTILGLRKIVTL